MHFMATIQKLSGKLRRQLSILNTTQAARRERAGLSRRTITNVFRGASDFKVSTLLAVADELGLDVVLVPKDAARAIDPIGSASVCTTVTSAPHRCRHML